MPTLTTGDGTGERIVFTLARDRWVAALAPVYVVAARAVVTGTLEIAAAIRLRDEIAGEWLLGHGGALPVAFGVPAMADPATAGLTLVLLFGICAILAGIVLLGRGLRPRGLRPGPASPATAPTAASVGHRRFGNAQ